MANYIQNYNGGVQFKTGASQGLTVDINGNIGVGTTPSTWTDNYKSIDLSGNGGIASTTAGYFQLANNAYVNSGGWKYKATGYSTLIHQTPTGAIQFQVATSGTVNTNITWNTAVTLDNSGNLFVGTPSQHSGSKLSIYGSGGIALADSSTANVTSAPTIKSVGNNLVFSTDASTSPVERIRIDTNGNLLLTSGTGALGYGTGAGGTVTQLTSKSTAVTLNKPSGQIITNNAALATNSGVIFILNNSLIQANDNIIITLVIGDATGGSYSVNIAAILNGQALIYIINRTGASRSEALTIKFDLIKGAVA